MQKNYNSKIFFIGKPQIYAAYVHGFESSCAPVHCLKCVDAFSDSLADMTINKSNEMTLNVHMHVDGLKIVLKRDRKINKIDFCVKSIYESTD